VLPAKPNHLTMMLP